MSDVNFRILGSDSACYLAATLAHPSPLPPYTRHTHQVFRVVFTVLFISYPSVSIKIVRLFKCRYVSGHYWMVADMRLQCFTRTWCVPPMLPVAHLDMPLSPARRKRCLPCFCLCAAAVSTAFAR